MSGKRLFEAHVTIRLLALASSEEQAERIAREHARDELDHADVAAFELRDLHSVADEWKRALPYGENDGRTVRAWMRSIAGA